MKRNSQKKRNIRRSSLKQKKKVQHGGEHDFIYDEIIGNNIQYENEYFVELLSKIIKKPREVYDLLTMFKETNASSKKQITLGQFQNVLKTFFLTPREIGDPDRLQGDYKGLLGFRTENMKPVQSNTIVEFKKNTGITKISGLQMAILYGRYELIKDLFYYKLPDKKHSVITPDMYESFYENINVIIDTTPNVATSQPEVVANSNALHLVFTCGVNIKNTPFIQSTSEIEKLRYLSEMYLIKQLFHQINKNWYKVIPEETSETPQISETSQISPPDYDNMKNILSKKLDTLKDTYVQSYISDSAKTNLTKFINKYLNVLNAQEENAGTNIKNLYIDIVNNKEFTEAITDKTLFETAFSKKQSSESNAEQINNYYNKFFNQLKEDYETIIDYEKINHNSKLDNSKFWEEYENLKKKNNDFLPKIENNDFLPEIEVIKENNDDYIDFVIYKQFIWNGTKSILLPNANDEIIKLNDTDYKLEYEGSLKTVILPGTNEINKKKIITEDNENIEESKKINIITLSSKSTVTVNEEFIITPIDIPEKSTLSEEESNTSDVESQEESQKGPDTSGVGPKIESKVKEEESEEA